MQSFIRNCVTRLRAFIPVVAAGITLLAGASSAHAADGYIFTPITGAQTQIDTNHKSRFTIAATAATVLKGGNFTMKSGTASTASIALTIYELASDNSKTLITSKEFVNSSAFCTAHGGNCGSFAPTVFTFATPVTLSPGKTYYAELTSPAVDTQSQAYFIKGGDTSCFVATASGTLIPGTNCSIGQNPPVSAPQLSVAKTGTASAAAGETISYTLTVSNTGSADATTAQVKDRLPAGLTFASASGDTGWSCGNSSGLITCDFTGTIAATSGTSTITVTATVNNQVVASEFTNTASVDPTGGSSAKDPGTCTAADISAGLCASFTTDATIAGPYLEITLEGPSPNLAPGTTSEYTATVVNHGGSPTSGPVHAYVQLPAGVTYVSSGNTDWQCTTSGNPVLVDCIYQGTSIAGNEGQSSFPVQVSLPANTPAGSSFTTEAYVGRTGGTATAPAQCVPDATVSCADAASTIASVYSVTKSAPVPPLQEGQQSVYTLSVTSSGVTDVRDVLPDGMTLVSAEGSGWDCSASSIPGGYVACRKDVTAGTSEEVTVTVATTAGTAGQTLVNYASVGPQDEAPIPGPTCSPAENCAERSAIVLPAAGFTLSKSAPQPGLEVNRQSTYTIRVTTTSESETVPVEVKDQLPQGLTFVSASSSWSCAVDASNLLLCQKTVAGGTTESLDVTVMVAPEINNQTITNYASAGPQGLAPQPGPSCVAGTDRTACAASPAATVADIREKIKKAVEDDVQAYLGARLDQLIGSFDSQSRLQRFRGTSCGVSHDLSMSGQGTNSEQNIAANGTFSMKGGIVPTADVPPDQCSGVNVWAQLDVGYVDGLDDSSSTGGMITVGAEYLITDNFLAGVRLSMDYTDAHFDSDANSDISGYGWLAGPYLSAEIANNLFLDGFIGYGTSWNDYSGKYENLDLSGDFTTQRIAGYLNLSGDYQTGAILLTPLVGVSFGKEWSDSFDVHNDIVGDTNIDSQEAGIGRLKGRVEAGYLLTDLADERMEVFLAPQVTYDFLRDAGPEGELLLGGSDWRGGLEGGFRFSRDRFGASLLVGYDGIGVSDWNAYHGQLQLNYTW